MILYPRDTKKAKVETQGRKPLDASEFESFATTASTPVVGGNQLPPPGVSEWIPGASFITKVKGKQVKLTVPEKSDSQILKTASRKGLQAEEYGITWILGVKPGASNSTVHKVCDITQAL